MTQIASDDSDSEPFFINEKAESSMEDLQEMSEEDEIVIEHESDSSEELNLKKKPKSNSAIATTTSLDKALLPTMTNKSMDIVKSLIFDAQNGNLKSEDMELYCNALLNKFDPTGNTNKATFKLSQT